MEVPIPHQCGISRHLAKHHWLHCLYVTVHLLIKLLQSSDKGFPLPRALNKIWLHQRLLLWEKGNLSQASKQVLVAKLMDSKDKRCHSHLLKVYPYRICQCCMAAPYFYRMAQVRALKLAKRSLLCRLLVLQRLYTFHQLSE